MSWRLLLLYQWTWHVREHLAPTVNTSCSKRSAEPALSFVSQRTHHLQVHQLPSKGGRSGRWWTALETHLSLAWSVCVTLSSGTLGLSVVVAL